MRKISPSKSLTAPAMAPPLQEILDAELSRGNVIVEVADWPPKCQLLVVLERPFHRAYDLHGDVTYKEVNDPHQWKADYMFKDGTQLLACRFE